MPVAVASVRPYSLALVRWSSPAVNLVLFVLTLATTLFAGALGSQPAGSGVWGFLKAGIPYAASLIGILLTHEMGHYVLARIHKVDASLPYFVPLPLPGGFGTLGAIIRIRSPIPSRNAVLDIGAAGPIAGFLVALPLLFWGFAHSPVVTNAPTAGPNAVWQSPFSLVCAIVRHQPIESASAANVRLMGDSLITWLAVRVTHGSLPESSDLLVSPVGYAAWIGMLVTALNLTPIGQLDGGHVVYALFGRWAGRISRACSWGLFGLGLFASWSWLIWWALTRFVLGIDHPPSADEAPLSPARRALALFALGILLVTFLPVPLYE